MRAVVPLLILLGLAGIYFLVSYTGASASQLFSGLPAVVFLLAIGVI